MGMTMTPLHPACMGGNSLESIKGPELPQELIFCVQTGQERQATPYSRVSRREAASQGAMAVPGSWQALRVSPGHVKHSAGQS